MSRTPSYLTLRNGIYYFQLRVPVGVLSVTSGKSLLRRSTRTGNRTEALKIARKWSFKFMEEEKTKIKRKPSIDEINALYKVTEQDDDLMREGTLSYA